MAFKYIWNIVILSLSCFLLTSCFSYRIVPKTSNARISKHVKKDRVFVLNADTQKEELKILHYSNIFTLTEDRSIADYTLQLQAPHLTFGCAMPLVVSLMTLGQFPVYLCEDQAFEFDLIKDGKKTKHILQLNGVVKRIWFWDLFSIKKNRGKVLGEILYREWERKNLH